MQDQAPKQDALFHKHFGWCLLEEAIEARMCTRNTFWNQNHNRGINEGWLTKDNRLKALQIFVLFDRVLLPLGFDIDLESIPLHREGHLNWADSVYEGRMYTDAELQADAVANFRPFVQRALAGRGYSVDNAHFTALVDTWRMKDDLRRTRIIREYPYFSPTVEIGVLRTIIEQDEQQGIHGRAAWARQRLEELEAFVQREQAQKELATLVSDEFYSLQQSLALAERGIPSFGYGASLSPLTQGERSPLAGLDESTPAILGIYFENSVRCPAPQTLGEALKLRENPSIEPWRREILSWSRMLTSGQIKPADIKAKVEEANGYIEGAQFLSRLIPDWSLYFTLPLGVAIQLLPGFQPLGWALIGLEVLKLYGHTVEKATGSPDRLQHKWLMISEDHSSGKK